MLARHENKHSQRQRANAYSDTTEKDFSVSERALREKREDVGQNEKRREKETEKKKKKMTSICRQDREILSWLECGERGSRKQLDRT